MSTRSSIPAVIDWLLTTAATLPEFAKAQICDGYPGTIEEPLIFVVGGAFDSTASGQQEARTMGRKTRHESYAVSCYLAAWTGDPAGQRDVREQAFTMFDALGDVLARNTTLGGAVTSGLVSTVELEQTTEEDAANGRVATISFVVQIENDIRI